MLKIDFYAPKQVLTNSQTEYFIFTVFRKSKLYFSSIFSCSNERFEQESLQFVILGKTMNPRFPFDWKLSFPLPTWVELETFARTRESSGGVQMSFRIVSWSNEPSPRTLLLKTEEILENHIIQGFPLMWSLASGSLPEWNRTQVFKHHSLGVAYKWVFQ